MKKHDMKMIAAWAAENGIRGYEHLDPKVQQQRRQSGIKSFNRKNNTVDRKTEKRYK